MDLIAFARNLIQIPSPTGDEGRVVAWMASALARLGWTVRRQPVSAGRDNLYATLDPPEVVLSTHLDVVPPHVELWEDDEWLGGRGSCDAKGIAAAMVAAAEQLRAQGERRVGLLFLVGEENSSDGALAAAGLEPRGRVLINGEPTENRLVIGHPGALRVNLTAQGIPAHSAYPEEGRSAVHLLLEALTRLGALPRAVDPLLGETTVNVGLIAGGVATNVLAPTAGANLLYRIVEPPEALMTAIRNVLPDHVSAQFPLTIAPFRSRALEGWEGDTVRFTTDLPLLTSWGEGYLLGPGAIRRAHTERERVRKQELLEGREAYVRLASHLLQPVSA